MRKELVRRKGRSGGTNFGNDLLLRIRSQTGYLHQPLNCFLVLLSRLAIS
jgi:hypothetical protein